MQRPGSALCARNGRASPAADRCHQRLPSRVVVDPGWRRCRPVCAADPSLSPLLAQAAVTAVAPRRVAARRLARGLSDRPGVLSDGHSPAPRVVGTLLVELRRRGATAISAPRCADCDKEMRTFGRRGENWFAACGPARVTCTACGSLRRVGSLDRDGRPFCHRCPPSGRGSHLGGDPSGDRGRPFPRRRQSWSLPCRRRHPGRGSAASWPGPSRTVPACSPATAPRHQCLRCCASSMRCVRPARPASCDRPARTAHEWSGCPAPGRPQICRGCEARLRAVPCARCGAVRDPATRDDQGRPVCPNCFIRDPANQEVCARCGRRRPVSVRGPDGPRLRELSASQGNDLFDLWSRRAAEIAKATGEPWCLACQKRWARCAGCGEVRPVRGGNSEHPPRVPPAPDRTRRFGRPARAVVRPPSSRPNLVCAASSAAASANCSVRLAPSAPTCPPSTTAWPQPSDPTRQSDGSRPARRRPCWPTWEPDASASPTRPLTG